MIEFLCCPPETIEKLLISYTLIKHLKVFYFKKFKKHPQPYTHILKDKTDISLMSCLVYSVTYLNKI